MECFGKPRTPKPMPLSLATREHTALPRTCTFTPSDWAALAAFWHPVAFSADIAGPKPFSATLLDEKLVLYRAGGRIVAAKDICIHRGVPLSFGRVEGEEVVCAYHGFRYGADGLCTRIPVYVILRSRKLAFLQTVLCEERFGVVWICLSGEPRQPLPDWPELDDLGLKQSEASAAGIWKCSAARHTENFNDLAHLSFVHVGTFGNSDRPEVPKYDVEVGPTGMHFETDYDRHSIEDFGGRGSSSISITRTTSRFRSIRGCASALGRGGISWPTTCRRRSRRGSARFMFRLTRDFDLDKPEDSSDRAAPGDLRGLVPLSRPSARRNSRSTCRRSSTSGPTGSRRVTGTPWWASASAGNLRRRRRSAGLPCPGLPGERRPKKGRTCPRYKNVEGA